MTENSNRTQKSYSEFNNAHYTDVLQCALCRAYTAADALAITVRRINIDIGDGQATVNLEGYDRYENTEGIRVSRSYSELNPDCPPPDAD